jgi:serine/threonine protein kinase
VGDARRSYRCAHSAGKSKAKQREKILREVSVLSNLHHPNIVR